MILGNTQFKNSKSTAEKLTWLIQLKTQCSKNKRKGEVDRSISKNPISKYTFAGASSSWKRRSQSSSTLTDAENEKWTTSEYHLKKSFSIILLTVNQINEKDVLIWLHQLSQIGSCCHKSSRNNETSFL